MNPSNVDIVTDLSNTLVKQEPLYDDALALVSREHFGGAVDLCMDLGQYGNPFPVHIRMVLEHPSVAEQVRASLEGGSTQALASALIDRYISPFLVEGFTQTQPEAIDGLEAFIDYAGQHGAQSGIVTGDLRAVAEILLANNTYRDIGQFFPGVTCGDDAGVQTRTDQIHRTYDTLTGNAPGELAVVIDDSSNGILCMCDYARDRALNSVVIGVETGSSSAERLRQKGADIVLPNIGRVPAFLGEYHKS